MHGGVDARGLFADLVAVLLVAGGVVVVGAVVGGGHGGVELVEQLVVVPERSAASTRVASRGAGEWVASASWRAISVAMPARMPSPRRQ